MGDVTTAIPFLNTLMEQMITLNHNEISIISNIKQLCAVGNNVDIHRLYLEF